MLVQMIKKLIVIGLNEAKYVNIWTEEIDMGQQVYLEVNINWGMVQWEEGP